VTTPAVNADVERLRNRLNLIVLVVPGQYLCKRPPRDQSRHF
jgi:hypothetical protein